MKSAFPLMICLVILTACEDKSTKIARQTEELQQQIEFANKVVKAGKKIRYKSKQIVGGEYRLSVNTSRLDEYAYIVALLSVCHSIVENPGRHRHIHSIVVLNNTKSQGWVYQKVHYCGNLIQDSKNLKNVVSDSLVF